MAFNFEKAISESATTSQPLLAAIVLGPSGAGKSTLMGSLGGKTLYLHTSGESHGPAAARTLGGENVIPIAIDQEGGKPLSSDAAYGRLLDILNDTAGIKKLGITCIAVDGASELEALIRSSEKWIQGCKSDNGRHNAYAEAKVTIAMFRPVLNALKRAQKEVDVSFVMTCKLDVKSMGPLGEIEEAVPSLQGYSVAESLIQQFDDVLVVGAMAKDGVVKHKLQFMSDVSKVSKDAVGTVKKAINFRPRLTGLLVETLPPIMDADLSKVLELKRKGKK